MKFHPIALYGSNGHQIQDKLKGNPRAALAALAGIGPLPEFPEARQCASLDELLAIPEVELVSLCSPRRADQSKDAIRALEAGKHVYAEKPVALSEAELDRILDAARASGRIFHSMCSTAFEQPYLTLREEVAKGTVGEIEQLHVRKSYPWFPERPFDAETDGGLLLWVGIHAARIAEQVSGLKLRNGCFRRHADCPPGESRRKTALAVSVLAELENGAPVTLMINLLNCRGTGVWGYEELQIFGSDGILESLAGGTVRRRIRTGGTFEELPLTGPSLDFFECFLDELEGAEFPLTQEQEFSPDRFLLRM